MSWITYRDGHLFIEDVSVDELVREYGSPLYAYSRSQILANFSRIDAAFADVEHIVCYAVKANSNPEVLALLAAQGAGADVVSAGELHLALQAGFPPQRIVFAGVGKRDEEIVAALEAGILGLNVESEMELQVIAELAQRTGRRAPVALRINPDIDIHGHPYISTGRHHDKFGIEMNRIPALLDWLAERQQVELVGLHVHLGSQITSLVPFERLGEVMKTLIEEVRERGFTLRYVDVGGGIGVRYEEGIALEPQAKAADDFAVEPQAVAEAMLSRLKPLNPTLVVEPGRALVANAGMLVTRVLYTKESGGRQFVIVDAGMTELIRPALYQAYHAVAPAVLREGPQRVVDVVGPVCESADFLARDRRLPPVERGDVLAVLTAGAYGYVQSSNYNARLRPPEIMVQGTEACEIRPRQSLESLWR